MFNKIEQIMLEI